MRESGRLAAVHGRLSRSRGCGERGEASGVTRRSMWRCSSYVAPEEVVDPGPQLNRHQPTSHHLACSWIAAATVVRICASGEDGGSQIWVPRRESSSACTRAIVSAVGG